MGCPRPKYIFSGLPISFASKNQTAPDFFFLWSQLHLGKLHRERAVTGRIFQALPTQTDTIIVTFPGVTENDLLWAGVCPGRPALPCPVCRHRQTDTMFAFIYKMLWQMLSFFHPYTWAKEKKLHASK